MCYVCALALNAQVVMMLFEREAAPEGAVIFARAALQHLPTAYGGPTQPNNSSSSDITGGSGGAEGMAVDAPPLHLVPADKRRQRKQQLRVREARLWSNIFKVGTDSSVL